MVNASGDLVRVGESIRALAELEGRERDCTERIGVTMARIGLNARDHDRTQMEGRRLGRTVNEVCQRLGYDLTDPDTLRVVHPDTPGRLLRTVSAYSMIKQPATDTFLTSGRASVSGKPPSVGLPW